MKVNKNERTVVVHTAGTPAEAMVIRALLQSASIPSPGSVSTDPFPLREVPEGTHGVEIVVRASDEKAARALIDAHLSGDTGGDTAEIDTNQSS
ncbi:MAG TPA: hypothetical protein VEJ39_03085 [Candidatus Acidoferrales bacterium]|nr:hypothetical protein [Candidatus Acidoferrales bacterium]